MSSHDGSAHEQVGLFAGGSEDRLLRTRNSMLWAAYGDAIGFISELVDDKGLKRRTKGRQLDRLMPWRRRVGGRNGVDVELPGGCWSDDTQLRLAVSRAIRNNGFDVESFARIELPIWPSYALGGGRASKAAAANLGKPDVLWYANTFQGWCAAGGNGAAMRIQPHVWSSRDLQDDFTIDVIADSVCTHGHPRAIVGACFHALTLAHCLRTGGVPDRGRCEDIAEDVGRAFPLIDDHRSLGSTWIGLWERETGKRLQDEWRTTVSELRRAISAVVPDTEDRGHTVSSYQEIIDRLELRSPDQRGSGILTVVAALGLARMARSTHEAVALAANAVGTDTDTIATMVGALLGACNASAEPPEEPMDSEYLRSEADRLTGIAQGNEVVHHSYPDVLTWVAPATQADALVSTNGRLVVEGLGPVAEVDVEIAWTPKRDFAWEWVRTEFGQTLLIKRRPEVRPLGAGNDLAPPPAPPPHASGRGKRRRVGGDTSPDALSPLDRGVNVDAALDYARDHISDDHALGYTVRRVARDGSLGDLVALLTALREQLRR